MSTDLQDTGFLLKTFMEHMTDNIYFKDAQSRFVMVNKAFCDQTGLSADQVVGKTDMDLFSEGHARQAYADEQRIIATGKPLIGIEEKETWQDGRITWVSTTKMPLKNADGKIIGTFGVSRDITAHKEAELQAASYAEQMKEDIGMAAELQKTFFPSSYPAFPEGASPEDSRVEFLYHHHASSWISGDFCTIRKLSDSETGIFICDVMGHGMQAALGTAFIRMLVQENIDDDADPGRFLGRMNKQLIPVLQKDSMFLYATACYVVFDASTGRVRMANAGHPVPLHFQTAGNTADWLMDDNSLRGPALAITQEAQFKTFESWLQPGDSIVMYTDGLYEVEREDGQEFGEDRLLEAAQRCAAHPLTSLFPALENAARQFTKKSELDDDVCIVGLHYKRLLLS